MTNLFKIYSRNGCPHMGGDNIKILKNWNISKLLHNTTQHEQGQNKKQVCFWASDWVRFLFDDAGRLCDLQCLITIQLKQ